MGLEALLSFSLCTVCACVCVCVPRCVRILPFVLLFSLNCSARCALLLSMFVAQRTQGNVDVCCYSRSVCAMIVYQGGASLVVFCVVIQELGLQVCAVESVFVRNKRENFVKNAFTLAQTKKKKKRNKKKPANIGVCSGIWVPCPS